ncbi:MAG: flippase [Candidatus Uhrbacteria bacterium]
MTTTAVQLITKNTAWFTFGSIGQKLFSFLYFTIIAMVFGIEGTARYFFALSFTALFAMFADCGISPVLTREVAKDRTRGIGLFRTAIVCKIFAIVGTLIVIAVITIVAGYSAATQQTLAIAAAALAIDAIHMACYAVLRGIQRVHYEAIGIIVSQIIVTAVGIAILITRAGLRFGGGSNDTLLTIREPINVVWILFPFILASVTNLVIASYGLMREGILRELRVVAAGSWRWLVRTAAPFAATSILARIYTYSDTFILSLLATGTAIGYYSTPFKIAFAFQFFPLAFMGALYPAMSAAAVGNRARVTLMFTEAVRVLLIIALPIAFGIGILADRILVTVYGVAFLPSAVPLALLAAAIPFTFVNFPAGYLLNACDRQIVNTKLIAIVTATNITLNLIFIPQFGAVGAAISALVATILLSILNFGAVHRVARYEFHVIFHAFLRIFVACLAMSAVILFVRSWPLGVTIAFGAATYIAIAFIARAIKLDDLRLLASAFRRRTPSVAALDVTAD